MDNYPNITYKRGCNPCNKGKEYPKISYKPSFLREQITPVTPEVIKQPLLEGKTYRVDIENWGIPKDATASDVVRFEETELGNKYGLSDSLLKELDNYSQRDTVWVTKERVDAEVYLSGGMTKKDISEIALPKGSRIIAEDGQGGYLVLRGDAEPKVAIPQAESNPTAYPEVKYKPSYLKEPFIKVGERVEYIGSSKYRYESWPKEAWLQAGVKGEIAEYHPEQPAVRVGGKYFEALPPYAVARWDFGGQTAIDADKEGIDWKRVQPSYLKEGKYVVIKSTGSTLSWESWLKDLEGYQRRSETPPQVEYPPLQCKYCGVPVPKEHLKGIEPEIWAGYHIKGHRDAVKKLAAKRLPWSAGLVPIEKPSYLKEPTVAIPETECQIIPPEYYDLLGWLGASAPDYSFAIEPGTRERKLTETLQKLKDGVARIHESTLFRDFLLAMSKFHYYSISNQMLIALQRPTATRVAGYVTWQDLGRQVKAGEKGIAILAPCLPPRILKCPLCEKTFTESELRTHLAEVHRREDVSILVREAREEAEAIMQPTPAYFKVVNVFDISQTEGKPLPEFEVPVLSGAANEELFAKTKALAKVQGLDVSFESRPQQDPAIKGTYVSKSIWVRPEEPRAQQLKSLLHEVAHYFAEGVFRIPRADAEVIAESAAFTVGAHFGFDTGTRSFSYVAIWSKNKEVLEKNLVAVHKVSERMIKGLEV